MKALNVLSIPRAHRLFQGKDVFADCTVPDLAGNCVYVTGDMASDRYRVATCDPTDFAKMPAMGVILRKDTPILCVVHIFGELEDLYTGLTVRKAVFVGLDGRLSEALPDPPGGGSVFVQHMGSVVDSSRILLLPNFHMVKRLG